MDSANKDKTEASVVLDLKKSEEAGMLKQKRQRLTGVSDYLRNGRVSGVEEGRPRPRQEYHSFDSETNATYRSFRPDYDLCLVESGDLVLILYKPTFPLLLFGGHTASGCLCGISARPNSAERSTETSETSTRPNIQRDRHIETRPLSGKYGL